MILTIEHCMISKFAQLLLSVSKCLCCLHFMRFPDRKVLREELPEGIIHHGHHLHFLFFYPSLFFENLLFFLFNFLLDSPFFFLFFLFFFNLPYLFTQSFNLLDFFTQNILQSVDLLKEVFFL